MAWDVLSFILEATLSDYHPWVMFVVSTLSLILVLQGLQ